MSVCRRSAGILDAWLDAGQLGDRDARHLAGCRRCTDALARVHVVDSEIRSAARSLVLEASAVGIGPTAPERHAPERIAVEGFRSANSTMRFRAGLASLVAIVVLVVVAGIRLSTAPVATPAAPAAAAAPRGRRARRAGAPPVGPAMRGDRHRSRMHEAAVRWLAAGRPARGGRRGRSGPRGPAGAGNGRLPGGRCACGAERAGRPTCSASTSPRLSIRPWPPMGPRATARVRSTAAAIHVEGDPVAGYLLTIEVPDGGLPFNTWSPSGTSRSPRANETRHEVPWSVGLWPIPARGCSLVATKPGDFGGRHRLRGQFRSPGANTRVLRPSGEPLVDDAPGARTRGGRVARAVKPESQSPRRSAT